MHQVLHFLAGPVIGGLIGYFTNYLAIRMLFRPRSEKRIGSFVVPFTPGVIPKRKDKLAREIGEAVAEKVFTKEDIEEIFLSDRMKQTVADGILSAILPADKAVSGGALLRQHLGEEETALMLRQVDGLMRAKVVEALRNTDLSPRITYECRRLIMEKIRGTILQRAMTPERIESMSDYLGNYLQQYVRSNVDELIMPILRAEIERALVSPSGKLMEEADLSEEKLREVILQEYAGFMKQHGVEVVDLFDIAGLTEKKIIQFQPEEIEALIFRTIKNEMQMVINLGALLGALIGLVTGLF